MIKIVKEVKKTDVLVITPLLPGHQISKETKRSIKRNTIPYTWITSEAENNIPTNLQNGLDWWKKQKGSLPKYYLMIDRDIILGRYMIDRMYNLFEEALTQTPDAPFAFCYASFEFKGHINKEFPANPYDINQLLRGNYISSNSMFKSDIVDSIGLVTDDKYKRLLDWAFYLKLFLEGPYAGLACPKAHFVAQSTEDDISARSEEDYKLKHKQVHDDFVLPIIEKYGK